MRRTLMLLAVAGMLGVAAMPASADIELCGTDTDTLGATIITYDECFVDSAYTAGDPITLTVNWTVDAGAAAFDGFVARGKKYTPRAKDKSAEGTDVTVLSYVDATAPGTSGSVTVGFSFSSLHPIMQDTGGNGNAHFVLILFVDEDGDGVPEAPAKFGVNVHVRSVN